MPCRKLSLIRHPALLNMSNRCYGQLEIEVDSISLNEAIVTLNPLKGLPVYSSPAQRCQQLAQGLNPHYKILDNLQELNFGSWEGKYWDAIPRHELDAWAADIWHYRVGGAETVSELRQRWLNVYQYFCQTEDEHILVISHAGIIRMALAEVNMIDKTQRWTYPIHFAKPYELWLPS